jgi:Lrp/AsnC family transcriptional regulator for asnA, asnC and gidA
MDDLDRLILRALEKDGRRPFTHIARQAGVSETTVRSRYHRLVEANVLRTVGIVDPHALGFRVPAIIGVTVEPGTADQVARRIAGLPEVSYLVMTLGSRDLVVEVSCRDLAHLTELSVERIQEVPGVRSIETLVIGRSYKSRCHWSPPDEEDAQQ